MRKLMLSTLLAAGVFAGSPRAARADCLIDAVNSCNEDIGNNQKELIAIRGWCYLIRAGLCQAGY